MLAERAGIEGRYELVAFIINLGKNGIGIRNYFLLFLRILGSFGVFGRTGIHPHRLQKIEINKIEVQVAGGLLFVGVEGRVPVEIFKRLHCCLSCSILEGR